MPPSDALWTCLFLLALRHNRRAESSAEVFRELVQLRVAVDLDGLLGGIANYIAVMAPGEVIFELGLGPVVHDAVEVIGQLVQEFRAFHLLPSPLSRF